MKSLSKLSVKKPITIIMATLVVIMLGVISLSRLTTDLFPTINLPYAIVMATYPGASPEEVESVVSKPIEQSVATISGIKNINSTSSENVSMVVLEFDEGTNMDSSIIELRENLDLINSFWPEEVSSPTIMKLNPDMMPIMVLSISFDGKSIEETTALLESELMSKFEGTEGVANVSAEGKADNVVAITLSDEKINDLNKKYYGALNYNTEMIKGIIKGTNFNMPNGYVMGEDGKYLVRTGDKVEDLDALKSLVITNAGNLKITLAEIADINILNINTDSYSKVNEENAILLTFQKQNSYAITDVVKNLDATIKKLETENKELNINVLMDQGAYIDMAVGSIVNNLMYGGILAVFVLLLFLKDIKPTIIIGLAIPISVMAAFIMIYFFDITMNIVSMGGLAIGIGMLVDNSIVVIENIYRLRGEGYSTKDAAIKGSKEVAGAITASTLTTISVFVPILFLEGMTAEIFKEMALTISFSLIASLLIALSLVPMMASKLLVHEKEKKSKFQEKASNFYIKVLKKALKHKIVTMLTLTVLLVGSFFLVMSKGMEYIPSGVSNQLNATVELDDNLTFAEKGLELDVIMEKMLTVEGVETISTTLSNEQSMMMFSQDDGASMYVLLEENLKRSYESVITDLEKIANESSSEVIIASDATQMSMITGSAISLTIKGENLDTLSGVTKDIEKIINNIEGVKNLENSITAGAPEIKVTVDKEKAIKYGLTTAEVYLAIADEINYDELASNIMIEEIYYDINVYPSIEKEYSVSDIENIKISTRSGAILKVSNIAKVNTGVGYGSITRDNQSRVVTLTGEIESDYNVTLVNDEIKESIEKYDMPKGYEVTYGGESAEIASSMMALVLAIILGIVLVYMIMAAQFESLLYPFIVMFTIPLAFTGSFLLMVITGTKLSIVSMIGLIILVGIIVNNGIVLVDYINHLRKDGMKLREAVITAGKIRMRPIIMTALTTILALTTMAIGIGDGAEMMAPMAIATIGGLIYATALTIIVVPVMYEGLNNLRKKKKND